MCVFFFGCVLTVDLCENIFGLYAIRIVYFCINKYVYSLALLFYLWLSFENSLVFGSPHLLPCYPENLRKLFNDSMLLQFNV